MEAIPTWILLLCLCICLTLSAFFSSSETGLMSLNRYKLRHQAEQGARGAKRAMQLLKRPDRLLGTILLGNNFVNIAATSIGTIIGIRFLGDLGVLLSTIILTVLVLVFSEVAPKTFAALYPERVSFPASLPMLWCVRALYPAVALINWVVLVILKPLGVTSTTGRDEPLTNEELKTIVLSSSTQSISQERQDMLIGVLDLEEACVEEAMVPRNDLDGIDLNDPWEEIFAEIMATPHARLLVYRDKLDNILGMLYLRDIVQLLKNEQLNKEDIQKLLRPCVFVPEGTPLRTQLLNFQKNKERSGLVVDEYGDIQGLITMEDILAHIVGDIGNENDEEQPEIIKQDSDLFEVEGGISLRQLNRELKLKLPLHGAANTLSGLIVETLGNFPEPETIVNISGCEIKVIEFSDGVVVKAQLRQLPQQIEDYE